MLKPFLSKKNIHIVLATLALGLGSACSLDNTSATDGGSAASTVEHQEENADTNSAGVNGDGDGDGDSDGDPNVDNGDAIVGGDDIDDTMPSHEEAVGEITAEEAATIDLSASCLSHDDCAPDEVCTPLAFFAEPADGEEVDVSDPSAAVCVAFDLLYDGVLPDNGVCGTLDEDECLAKPECDLWTVSAALCHGTSDTPADPLPDEVWCDEPFHRDQVCGVAVESWCTVDSDCGEHFYCDAEGKCRVDEESGCTSDAECEEGLVCRDATFCDDDESCQWLDVCQEPIQEGCSTDADCGEDGECLIPADVLDEAELADVAAAGLDVNAPLCFISGGGSDMNGDGDGTTPPTP